MFFWETLGPGIRLDAPSHVSPTQDLIISAWPEFPLIPIRSSTRTNLILGGTNPQDSKVLCQRLRPDTTGQAQRSCIQSLMGPS